MIHPHHVHETLLRHQLVDGYDIVFDLDHSHGVWIRDAKTGDEFLDAFTCFASWPVGYNHAMLLDPEFQAELTRCARTKLANSDLYTAEMASFVEAFGAYVTPDDFPYHFWVSGGALAVENAIKTAFDWKARKLGRTDLDADVNDLVILHFKDAFHGRSGYTMSLTNTVPDKIGLYPKFDWPRVHNPAIVFDIDGGIANDIEAEEARAHAEIKAVFEKHKGKVAAILLEPMQGEGGDHHFRPEFLAALREYCDTEEALLCFDEVQTGFFGTGRPWYWQVADVTPDVVAFGKKTQVCGIYASQRLDEVEDHVFKKSSRINSTWGGNLVDMVRCRRFIEIIRAENLAEKITEMGQRTLAGLRGIARETGAFSNVRGLGSLIAFTFDDHDTRSRMLEALYDKRVLALPSGPTSIRFRLPLVIGADEVDELVSRVAACVPTAVGA
ncbi:MAG: L-lysine 6-transaminase [Planctomycetota bacterium]|jgi:L-lysine 6-transaminase